MISKKLGYSFVDREIVQMVAKEAKVSSNWVEHIEKEAGGALLKFMSGLVSKRFFERILTDDKGFIDEEIYVDLLHEVIGKVGREGKAVIIGRGSQYILRDNPDVIHVLLVADEEDRIRFMEKKYKLTTKQAIQTVATMARRRISLYKKFGKEDYDNPNLYHLVLNMSKIDFGKACDLVCKLAQTGSTIAS